MTKRCQLADELFAAIRLYRRISASELPVLGAFRVGMVACASRADVDGWCKCVGSLVADLGFGELTREEAGRLHPLIVDLCSFVP